MKCEMSGDRVGERKKTSANIKKDNKTEKDEACTIHTSMGR